MTDFQKIRRKALFEILDKFPDLPNLTTAKLVYSKYPELFDDVEHARTHVRIYRGRFGATKRREIKTNKYFRDEI